jgi:hypothetical protein
MFFERAGTETHDCPASGVGMVGLVKGLVFVLLISKTKALASLVDMCIATAYQLNNQPSLFGNNILFSLFVRRTPLTIFRLMHIGGS